jgi:chemotaxis protein MotB
MRSDRKKNGSSDDSGSSGGGWELIYTGFILIMLCFFIMLCSFSSVQGGKVMRFVRSFAAAVSILPGGHKFQPGDTVLPDSEDIIESKSDLAGIFEDLKEYTRDMNLEGDVQLEVSKEGLMMRLSDHALFESGAAEISPKALPLLEKVGTIISQTPYAARIEGHTDDWPIHTGQFPSNWELSTARAVNVLRFLTDRFKLPAQRLSAAGFAEFKPLVPNTDPKNRARNRRVEIIFIAQPKQDGPAEVVE